MPYPIIIEVNRRENIEKWGTLTNRPVNTWIRDVVCYRKADFKLAPLTRFMHLIQKHGIAELEETRQTIDSILGGGKPDSLVDIVQSALTKEKASTTDKIWGALTFKDGSEIADNNQREAVQEFVDDYKGCSFWPHESNSGICKSEFWSENHILLYLSSAVLFKQRCDERGVPSGHVGHAEVNLLKDYLEAHVNLCGEGNAGVYEVLSGTYLPHTMKALLNLFDFSTDAEIKTSCDKILCAICKQFLLVTDANGVCSITATCRAPHKNELLLQTHGHHTDDLIKFLLPDKFGNLADSEHISDFGEFLLTSEWAPSSDPSVLEAWALTDYSGSMNHSTEDVQGAYRTAEEDAAPFYCSAGLLMHPKFVEKTSAYREKCGLAGAFMNILKTLSDLGIPIKSVSESISVLTLSQRYCDINLKAHKTPARTGVLTSFQNFNPGRMLFQQIPWSANVDGVAVYTVCPLESEAMAEFVQKRQHSSVSHVPTVILSSIFGLMTQKGKSPPEVAPCVVQERNIALIVYALPEGMRDDVKAFWPRSFFSEEIGGDPGEKNMWWLGSRVRGELTTFVGLLCNKKTTTSVCEGKHYECSYDNQARPDEKNVYRVSNGNKCAWVCVLGDSSEYGSLTAFGEYVHSLELATDKSEAAYTAVLSKDGNAILTASVTVLLTEDA